MTFHSTRRDFLKIAGGAMASLSVPGCGGIQNKNSRDADRPNIIVIMADDMGFSDLRCYGGEIDTPHIERLANNGIRFSQFYNAARCCPTRASLLTGLYPHQAGIGHLTIDYHRPGYRGTLSNNCITIAEVLKTAGYQTMMAGKWHVSRDTCPEGPRDNWPRQRGFDRFYGTLIAMGSYWDPATLMRDNSFIQPEGDYYYTEAISNAAVSFVEQAAQDKPFFLYVAYTAPHHPFHARPEVIRKYKGRFAEGWDVLRQKRYERMRRSGLIDEQWGLSARDQQSMPWEEAPHKQWEQHRMEVYAAMIDHMDQGIGDLLSTLEKTGRWDNTLIFFLSDNGASAEGHRHGLIERRQTPWRGKSIPEKTRDGRPVTIGDFPDTFLGPDDTYGGYDIKWSNLCNAPFRLHKSWVHEGGISTPMIIHWPGQIRPQKQWYRCPAHVIDIMATCLDVAGARYPASRKGHSLYPMEGISLRPAFRYQPLPEKMLFWEHEGNRAARRGRWKLVLEYPGEWKRTSPAIGRWELYDMEKDRTELNNLAHQRPGVVREMVRQYENWARRTNVVDWQEVYPLYLQAGSSLK